MTTDTDHEYDYTDDDPDDTNIEPDDYDTEDEAETTEPEPTERPLDGADLLMIGIGAGLVAKLAAGMEHPIAQVVADRAAGVTGRALESLAHRVTQHPEIGPLARFLRGGG